MAFVPGFEHDIFISYAHLNDPVGEDNAARWVTRFHARLESALRQLAGKPLVIWHDLNLERNQEFDKTIKAAVESSALFLAINSLVYQASPYCQAEIKWFTERVQVDGYGVSVGDRQRFFQLLLNNIPIDEWPEVFTGTTGYDFYEKKPGKKIALPCDQRGDHFQARLDDLVIDLFTTLKELKKAPKPIQKTVALSSANDDQPAVIQKIGSEKQERPLTDFSNNNAPINKRVFLAYARVDQQFVIELAERLRSYGVQIWLDQWDIKPGADWNSSIDEALYECGVFLIVLSEFSVKSREVRGELQTAINEGKHIIPVLYQACRIPRQLLTTQYVDFSKGISDQQALCKLIDEFEGERGATLVPATNIEDLRTDSMASAETTTQARSSEFSVLIDAHAMDQSHCKVLSQFFRNQGVDAYVNKVQMANPQARLDEFEERLKHAKILIIVFGKVTEAWVKNRLHELSKIAIEDKGPLRAVGIYFATTRRKEVSTEFLPGVLPIYLFDSFDLANHKIVQPLLDIVQ